jgi:hypothetical protein
MNGSSLLHDKAESHLSQLGPAWPLRRIGEVVGVRPRLGAVLTHCLAKHLKEFTGSSSRPLGSHDLDPILISTFTVLEKWGTEAEVFTDQ